MARRFNGKYYLSEGFHSIFTHGFMSFAAVCMIVACLLIMGSFTLLAVNLDHMLGDLEDENLFLAYIDDMHPDVAFSLYSNDSELFNLPVAPLRQRILAVFGKKLNQQLLSVDVNTTMIKLSGYVAKPETARKKQIGTQFIIVFYN